MNILNRLTIKHLCMNKRRTIVTIIGIILSCSLMVGLGTIASSFREYLIHDEEASGGKWHAEILGVPYSNYKYIENNAMVSDSYVKVPLGYTILENGSNSYKPYLYVLATNDSYLKTVEVLQGRLPENEHELLISNHIESNGGVTFEIGDEITLDLGVRYLDGMTENDFLGQNNPYEQDEQFHKTNTKTYTVVGIIERLNDEPYSAPGYTVLTKVNDTIPKDALSDVAVIYRDVKNVHDKSEALAQIAGAKSYLTTNEDGQEEITYDIQYHEGLLAFYGESSYTGVNNTITGIVILVLTLVSIGCILVIYNSFAISVMERKKQFGLFASIGATKRQIRKTVLFEAFLVGVIGIPLGFLGGIFGIYVVIQIINALLPRVFDIPLTLSFYPMFLILPLIYMIATIFVSAWLPARAASKISPIEAIRLNDDIKVNKKKMKINRWVERILGVEGLLALKNLKRNKKKYRITIISLVVSIVLFLGFSTFLQFGIGASNDIFELNNYDIYLSLEKQEDETADDIIQKVKSAPQIEQIQIVLPGYNQGIYDVGFFSFDFSPFTKEYGEYLKNEYGEEKMEWFSLPVYVLEQDTYFAYLEELGLSRSNYEGRDPKLLLLNELTMKDYTTQTMTNYRVFQNNISHLQLDLATIKPLEEDQFKEKFEENYDVVTHEYPVTLVNKSPSLLERINMPCIYISEEMLEEFTNDFITYQGEVTSNHQRINIYLKATDSDDVEKALNQQFQLDGNNNYLYNYAASKEQDRNTVIVIQLLLYGFITLVTLIGVTSVFNTINTSMALRRREFAVLRSVGLSPKGFKKMLCWESIFYGLSALGWGLPISFLVILLFNNVFEQMIQNQFFFPMKELIICIIAVFVIVFMTVLYATKKIKKENILDAIREENI